MRVRGVLHDLRVLLGLIRAGGPGAIVLLVCYGLKAFVPAASALFLGHLVGAIEAHGVDAGLSAALVVPLLLLGAVLLVGRLLDVLVFPLVAWVTARIDGRHRSHVLEIIAEAPDLALVESEAARRAIREVSADPTKGFEATPAAGALAALRSIAGGVGVAGAAVLLVQYSWWLIPLVFVPVFVNRVLQTRYAFGIGERWRAAAGMELPVDVWRRATVSIAEAKDIRTFGLVDWVSARMDRDLRRANSPLWSYNMRMVRGQWAQSALILVALAPTYVLVATGAVSGVLPASSAIAIIAAGWAVFSALPSPWDRVEMANSVGLVSTTEELAATLAPREKPVEPRRHVIPESVPTIEFQDVRFRYPGSDRDVLRGVDLRIEPGELIGLVGLSGAGKSTLMKLLGGLYEPTGGRILVDGVDLATIDPSEWRRRISIQFQDFTKFHLSVKENVSLNRGDVDTSTAALETAANRSGLARMLSSLPNGWDTPLSRDRLDGVDLSGGQWQQVILSRSLYAAELGASVLALDEPTAHLDVRTEFETFDRLQSYRGAKSVILISHRLSTVRGSDRIALLDGGVISELGTHDELIRENGKYAEMFEIQAARFQASEDR